MNTVTKLVTLGILCLFLGKLSAQDINQKADNALKIESLSEQKETITNEEKEFLKQEVESINQRLDRGDITEEEADKLKQQAAQKRALNIENRLAIIDNKIELMKRNAFGYSDENSDESAVFGIAFGDDEDDFMGFRIRNKPRHRKYDRRSYNDFVFAIGINNAIVDGESLGDSYQIMGSGFVELGWAWKTRVFENSNAVRFQYGLSLQWNKLSPKHDKYFVQNGNETTLEDFPSDLRQSKFRTTNLVIPVHFEFGPSRRIERENYFRYSLRRQFKLGIGGYAGVNVGTIQKLRYKENGDRVKEKMRRNFNTSDFIYGLSGYVGIDNVSLYMKYDLNTLFKDQVIDQHNISLGLRFDLD